MLFLGSFRHIFRKYAQTTPKRAISKNIQTALKFVWHRFRGVGALPRCSESHLEKVRKSSFLVSSGDILRNLRKKIFFPKNQILFQLPPPFLILFHLLLSLFLDPVFFENPKCAFPTQNRRSTKVLQ